MKIQWYDKHKKKLMALGRNGFMWCNGLDIDTYALSKYYKEQEEIKSSKIPPFIAIRPINSKEHTGRCYIEIPMYKLPQLIIVLEEIYKEWAS